ncbi:MAG: hypothetical protein IJC64_04410 [Clostridia bacterium]|nr:hypothetical protein [Clostridia bacterium]
MSEQKGNVFDSLKRVSENVTKVFQSGVSRGIQQARKVADNEFWNGFTDNGSRTTYARAFSYWGSEYLRPAKKIIFTQADSGMNTFSFNTKLKRVESAYFDFSQKARGTGTQSGYYFTFYNCKALEEIEDIGMQPDFTYNNAFANCVRLHTIAKMRADEDTAFTNAFDFCNALQNVTFEGVIGQNLNVRWSTKLSKDSISNIVSCLSDTASGKTLSLSKTAVNNAFTDAEWTALADTKKNWTISLV